MASFARLIASCRFRLETLCMVVAIRAGSLPIVLQIIFPFTEINYTRIVSRMASLTYTGKVRFNKTLPVNLHYAININGSKGHKGGGTFCGPAISITAAHIVVSMDHFVVLVTMGIVTIDTLGRKIPGTPVSRWATIIPSRCRHICHGVSNHGQGDTGLVTLQTEAIRIGRRCVEPEWVRFRAVRNGTGVTARIRARIAAGLVRRRIIGEGIKRSCRTAMPPGLPLRLTQTCRRAVEESKIIDVTGTNVAILTVGRTAP